MRACSGGQAVGSSGSSSKAGLQCVLSPVVVLEAAATVSAPVCGWRTPALATGLAGTTIPFVNITEELQAYRACQLVG